MNKAKSNNHSISKTKIAIIGGGPTALFIIKNFIDKKIKGVEITIFERSKHLGFGFPYGDSGANKEHITNVSANEIPKMETSVRDWVKTAPKSVLKKFHIDAENFNDYKVMPRLFFGYYLNGQFKLLLQKARREKLKINVELNIKVEDVFDLPKENKIKIKLEQEEKLFDNVMICTGHSWPKKYEGKIKNYFDSPYPPSKLKKKFDQPIAVTGASLTAIDAIRTLARANGKFIHHKNGDYSYIPSASSKNFKLVLHSLSGLLPGMRFHLKNPRLIHKSLLTEDEIDTHKIENGGFISLDYIFEKDFKEIVKREDRSFYETIKNDDLESFVAKMLAYRKEKDAIQLFKEEYEEAKASIEERKSIYWKEALAMLSFSMNYPAKYFSAEDMQRLQKHLMPLIAMVIAFVPQGSAREVLALYKAGVLDLISVDSDSKVLPLQKGGINYRYKVDGKNKNHYYEMYVNAIGQPHFDYKDFIFKGLIKSKALSEATLAFQSKQAAKIYASKNPDKVKKCKNGEIELIVSGIKIDEYFRPVNQSGETNPRIYILAVPYIGGYNPDYSGLDFGEAASEKVLETF